MGEGPGKVEIFMDRIVKVAEEVDKKEREKKRISDKKRWLHGLLLCWKIISRIWGSGRVLQVPLLLQYVAE